MFIRHVLMRKVSLQAFPGLNEIPTRLQRQEEKDREDLPIYVVWGRIEPK